MRLRMIVAFLLAFASAPLFAQPAHLVKDIFTLPAAAGLNPQKFAQVGSTIFFAASDRQRDGAVEAHGVELWAVPLAARDVSLEEQIDELIALMNGTVLETVRLPASLNAFLTNARSEVGNEQIAGQFVAARVQLTNFISAVGGLVARGSLTPSEAQQLLDDAAAILEQIEGNRPKKSLLDDGREGGPESD